jgi:hypothetical protein
MVMRAAPDGAFLAVQAGSAIYQFSPDPLALTRAYTAGPLPVYYNLNGISPEGHILSIVHQPPNDPYIIAIDAATGGIVRSLGAADVAPPHDMLMDALVLAGGEIATFHDESFIIRRPIDHAAAAPIAFANACLGGSFVDSFNDPASGWPTQVTDTLIASYVPGAYRFYFSDPGQLAAVTRGDVWNNADLLQVNANLIGSQYGTFGIVYGINADWSDFYSFEILPFSPNLPQSKRWYLLHFHGGAWELVESGPASVTDGDTFIALDRDVYTGEINIKINGSAVTTIPEFNGRVGLAASSLWNNIEALFYSYRFDGENCVEDGSRLAGAARFPTDDSRFETNP